MILSEHYNLNGGKMHIFLESGAKIWISTWIAGKKYKYS